MRVWVGRYPGELIMRVEMRVDINWKDRVGGYIKGSLLIEVGGRYWGKLNMCGEYCYRHFWALQPQS